MIINETYSLTNKNYIELETIKKQIVIGHTDNIRNDYIKWTHRMNGKYTKVPAYSISVRGEIFKHFDPIFFSNVLGNLQMDQKSIVILLENDGWLSKKSENEPFINWIGHIYNKPDVVEKKWRNYTYWAPYTPEQFESALNLVDELCGEFGIPRIVVTNNTKMDNLDGFSGVLYKSNLEKHFTDLSPAWAFEDFYDKLEKK